MPRGSSRFRGRGISQAQRRKKTWVGMKELAAAGAASPGFLTSFHLEPITTAVGGDGGRDGFIAMTGDGSGTDPFLGTLPAESTILRIRGSLLFPKNEFMVEPQGLTKQFSFGIGVTGISDNVVSSYPAPISDVDWDGWMFLRGSAVAPVDSVGSVIDIKAMRKVNDGEALFAMAEVVTNTNGISTGSFLFDIRVLLLLP